MQMGEETFRPTQYFFIVSYEKLVGSETAVAIGICLILALGNYYCTPNGATFCYVIQIIA